MLEVDRTAEDAYKLARVRSNCSGIASCAGPSSICPGAHAVETLEGASETAFVNVSGSSCDLLDGLRGHLKRGSRHLEANTVNELFGRFAGRIGQASARRLRDDARGRGQSAGSRWVGVQSARRQRETGSKQPDAP